MIDELKAIAVFAESVRQSSFRAAAKKLGLSPSVVSYHITQLEERLGTALIYRSTRKLSLTHEGEVLYRHALEMLSAAEQGLRKVVPADRELRGKLTVTMPSALTLSPVNRRIAGFCERHPGVEMNIAYSDARRDLIAEGIDLAIRAGDMENSTLKSKRIGQVERRLVCAPAYMQDRPPPTCPADLDSWRWIRLAMLPEHRTLQRPGHASAVVPVKSNVCVDSVEAMTQLCLHGLGLATPPDFLVEEALARGDLIEVLTDWRVEPIPLFAVWPGNVAAHSNTRRLLDHLLAD